MTIAKIKLPKTKDKWKTYTKVFLPLFLSALIFSFNGIVDNFMVGHIEQGQAALGVVNAWSNIISVWCTSTAAASTMIISQFYYVGKYEQARKAARWQMNMSFYFTAIVFVIGQINPRILYSAFYRANEPAVLENADKYFRIISFRWLIMAFGINIGNMLNALGFGKLTLQVNSLVTVLNISFNAIFMYLLNMGVRGAAISTLINATVGNMVKIWYIKRHNIKAFFNPLTIFRFDTIAIRMFFTRSVIIFAALGGSVLINFRTSLYTAGYAADSMGAGVGGMQVLALSGAFMSMFQTAFSSGGAMAARFVGSELAKGEYKQAKLNSDEVKGFILVIGISFALLLAAFSFAIPYMHFLAEEKTNSAGIVTFDSSIQLHQVARSLLIMSFFFPFWGMFSTSYNNSNSAGKSWKMALYGLFQEFLAFGWLALIMFAIVPNNSYIGKNIWVAYALFYFVDIIKWIVYNIFYYKYDWLHSVSKEEEKLAIKKQERAIGK